MELSLLLKLNNRKKTVKAQIAELVLDASLNELHTMNSKVTQFPVEDGATITDHVFNEPVKVSINGIITNNPLPEPGESFFGELDNLPVPLYRAQAAYYDLLKIRENRLPVSIVTGLANYSNMMLNSLVINRNSRTGDSLEFTADFTHVKIVKSSFVTVNKLKSDTEHAADKVDAGKKTPKDLNKDKEDAKKASLLAKMYKHVSGISQEARLSE